MRLAIYTAMFGDKDIVTAPLNYKGDGTDYFLFSDRKPNYDIFPYRFIKCPIKYKDLAKNAREIKIIGHDVLNDYPITIWHDANIEIDRTHIDDLISTLDEHAMISTFKHSYRDCFYSEAMECVRVDKGNPLTILRQSMYYFFNGLPAHNGLNSTGILIRKNQKISSLFFEFWLSQTLKFSRRDQLSLCFTQYKLNAKINIINDDIFNTKYAKYHLHRHKDYKDRFGKKTKSPKWLKHFAYYCIKIMRKLKKR